MNHWLFVDESRQMPSDKPIFWMAGAGTGAGTHICHNGGGPCFHQKSPQTKKEEIALHPNAYYPPGALGVDENLNLIAKIQHAPRLDKSKTDAPTKLNVYDNIQDDYGFLAGPRLTLFNCRPIIFKDIGVQEQSSPKFENYEANSNQTFAVDRENGLRLIRESNVSPNCRSRAKPQLGKHSSKLRRRKTSYLEKKDGRSRSLTHIDRLDPAMLLRNEDMDSRSEPDTSHDQILDVSPSDGESRETRRKKLARSQVSSSEFFSICFEGELGTGLEEFLPVTRGTCLGDALRPIFEKKNINIAQVNIFVDSSKTPLPSPACTDTYFVAGKNLTIKAKEPDHKFHSRSFKQPSRKSSTRTKHKFFSSSTEDTNNCESPTLGSSTLSLEPSQNVQNHIPSQHGHGQLQLSGSISHEGSLKVKSTKQVNRWSGLFTNSFKDNSKMDLLVEQLNDYSINGIPKPSFIPSADEIESQYSIEKDWKDIVHGWQEMSERNVQQQTAIWELVETEIVYLKTIKVITDLFLSCIYNLQAANILNEIDRDQLFSNIPDIYKSNQILWLDCILPMVQNARDSKQPFQLTELGNGFLQFGSTCQPYTKYCLDQTKCQQYCREKYQENEYFKTYLAWCETRKECNRLRLMDILVRPMQRMTKYSLLLKAILKHTEDLEQRKCLEEMISSVERFVRSVNGALKSRQDAERLQGIAERIEAYEVVETREDELESLVKAHSKLDLFHPMPGCTSTKRWLIFDVDLKIKDSFTSKMEAHCFLFTDMLLICKPVGRKGERMKVIRQPYVVDRLITKELSKDPCSFGLVYLNEYGTASAALSLHFNEQKLVKLTMDHIKRAQKNYNDVKEKEHSEYRGDEDNTGMMYLNHHRGGSSRGSQLSSLVHSHSGSVEMNEASILSSQAVSFEHELRGSSLSSDDGNINESTGLQLVKSRSLSTETGAGRPSSPRRERRLFLSKSPSPNTLSVQIPVPNLSGQSLPNLPSASDSSPPSYSHHCSLTVPKSLLSPTHRGVSYPPPSPRTSLTRSYAVLQSRNPPLQKSKNILGQPSMSYPTTKTASLDVQVPEIRNPVGAYNVQQQQQYNPEVGRSKEIHPTTHAHTIGDQKISTSTTIVHHHPLSDIHFPHYDCSTTNQTDSSFNSKRLARNDRPDSKRYYTAGAIEDIKKETSRDRDSAIHKRLSWNYGQQQPMQGQYDASLPSSSQLLCNESMTSIRSSSGVSSTSSLFHCISDLESSTCSTASASSKIPCTNAKLLPDVRIAVCEPAESEVMPPKLLLENDLQEISNHIGTHFVEGAQCPNCSTQQHEHDTASRGSSNMRQSLSHCSVKSNSISSESAGPSQQQTHTDSSGRIVRNFAISDSSVETSDV